jgi:hypothetical protein
MFSDDILFEPRQLVLISRGSAGGRYEASSGLPLQNNKQTSFICDACPQTPLFHLEYTPHECDERPRYSGVD